MYNDEPKTKLGVCGWFVLAPFLGGVTYPTKKKTLLLLIIQILIQTFVIGAMADYFGALAIDDVHLPIVALESGSRFWYFLVFWVLVLNVVFLNSNNP